MASLACRVGTMTCMIARRDPVRGSVRRAALRSRQLRLDQMHQLKGWGLQVADAQARGEPPPPWPEDIPPPLDLREFNEAYEAAIAEIDPAKSLEALTRTDLRVALLTSMSDQIERDAYIAVLQMQSTEVQSANVVRATWALVAATVALAAASVALIFATIMH